MVFGVGSSLVGHGFEPCQKARFEKALAAGGAKVAKIARRVRQAGVYFATTDTWERHAIFVNNELARIVVDQIASCRDRGFYKLHAFVLMPEHLHLLITPGDETSIEKAMQMIKGGSSHRMGIEKPQAFPIWHRSFHDRWIRDAEQYRQAKSYIEQNPVKAGLVRGRGIRMVVGERKDRARPQPLRRASG